LDDARNSTESRIDALLSHSSDPWQFPISRCHQHQTCPVVYRSQKEKIGIGHGIRVRCLAFVGRGEKNVLAALLVAAARQKNGPFFTNLISSTCTARHLLFPPFQIMGRFGKSRCIIFATRLDKHYV